MPLMRSPDGSETVEVPVSEMRHYLSLGATLAGPAPSTEEFLQANPGAPYSGGDDSAGLETPNLAGFIPTDPVEIPAMMGAGLARTGGRILAGGAAAAAKGVGSAVGRAAQSKLGKVALEEGVEMLPWAIRRPLRWAQGIGKALSKGGEEVVEKAGSAASRVATKAGNEASEAGRALAKKRWSAPKPKGKVVGEIKPKTGSAESRVSPKGEAAPARAKRLKQRQKDNRRHPQMQQQPQIQVGSDLEARLAQAVKVEQHMNKLGFTDAEKALVRQQLMNQ